jgi:hypothetical protein
MRRTIASFFVFGLFSALSFVGCGPDRGSSSSSSKSSSGGEDSVTLDNLGVETAKAFCALAFSCCEQAELVDVFDQPPKDQAECEATFSKFYEMQVLPDLRAGVEAGRLTFDGAQASLCYEKVASNCDALHANNPLEQDPACQTVFVGKVAEGGECLSSNECVNKASSCAGKSDTMMFGKCKAPGPVDAACEFGDECESGYCNYTTMKCAAQAKVGEACQDFDQCADSFCDFSASLCTARKADGQTCMGDDECTSDTCNMTKNVCETKPPTCDGK